MKSLSCVWLSVTPWTVAHQAPPSMEFSRQEYWSGLSFPSPGDLPDPGIEPRSPELQADALPSEPPGKHQKSQMEFSRPESLSGWPFPSLGDLPNPGIEPVTQDSLSHFLNGRNHYALEGIGWLTWLKYNSAESNSSYDVIRKCICVLSSQLLLAMLASWTGGLCPWRGKVA